MIKSFLDLPSAPESFATDDYKQPEAPLWRWLDAQDVPFRTGPWILDQQYGNAPAYPKGPAEITLPHGPFEDTRHTPWTLYASGHDSPALPELHCEVYGHNWRHNFDAGVTAIASQFGPPHRMTRNNAKSAVWRWGRAELSCTVWPPAENTYPNSRHDALPQTIGAARISIQPAWCPPTSLAMRAVLKEYNCVYTTASFAKGAPYQTTAFECRSWPEQPAPGVWMEEDSPVVLLSYPDRPVILPCHRLTSLEFHVVRPARGGGHLGISLQLGGPTTHHYTLRSAAFDETTIEPMRAEARALAQLLDLPRHETEALDA